MLKLLISFGADVKIRDKLGMTLTTWAMSNNHFSMIPLLAKNGSVDARAILGNKRHPINRWRVLAEQERIEISDSNSDINIAKIFLNKFWSSNIGQASWRNVISYI